ncbi:MAG: glycosyltransferase [Candidatus Anammoxibacter sp.]
MKIAFVSTYLPKQCGIATYTDYLIRGLRKISPELEIKVIAETGALPIKQEQFEVNPCWNRNEDYVKPIIEQAKGVDVVHIQHEYGIYKLDNRLPSVLRELGADVFKVLTIHCIRPAQFSEVGTIEENFIKEIALLADEVIIHLESQKSILERLGVPVKKINVIQHGTELSNEDKKASRIKLGLPEDEKILLVLGFIRKNKYLHVLLDALAEILDEFKDVFLFIGGTLHPLASQADIDYAKTIPKRIAELGIGNNVIHRNSFISNEDIPYVIGASDIVLFPYVEQDRSASGAFRLAIGAGKPVIATRIPKFEDLKEVCEELLVLPYSSSEIAKIAIRLFKDVDFKNYVQNKISVFKEKTSWANVAKIHLDLYKQR